MFEYLFKKRPKKDENKEKNTFFVVNQDGLELLYDYIEKNAGISLQKSKVLVKSHIIMLCEKLEIDSFVKLLDKVKGDSALFAKLVETVTVHETYFFREKKQLIEALKKYKEYKSLTILSAPSSSGEEAYSIAILALEMGIKNFHITGIDISSSIIEKAKHSTYTQRSVNFLDADLIEKYFIKQDEKYIVKEHLKRYITFKQLNLFEEKLYELGKYDIIFSRNMFIYFKDEKKIEAYKRLESLKKDVDASIYLGHADISSKLSKYIRSQK